MFRYMIIHQFYKSEKSLHEKIVFHTFLMPFIFPSFAKILYYSCCHPPLLHSSLLLISPARPWMAPLLLYSFSSHGVKQSWVHSSLTLLSYCAAIVSDQCQAFPRMFLMAVMGKWEWEDRGHRAFGVKKRNT